jgi:hypothetical protein
MYDRSRALSGGQALKAIRKARTAVGRSNRPRDEVGCGWCYPSGVKIAETSRNLSYHAPAP